MAVHTSTATARPPFFTTRPPEQRAPASIPGQGHATRGPAEPVDERVSRPNDVPAGRGSDAPSLAKTLPLFRGVGAITSLRRYERASVPFFYLRGPEPFAVPLSGRLNARQRPPRPEDINAIVMGPTFDAAAFWDDGVTMDIAPAAADRHFDETAEARMSRKETEQRERLAGARAFAVLNEALHLSGEDGTLFMHHVDDVWDRHIRLGSWQQLAQDARACAIVNCLLRLSYSCSWYLSDSELLSNTLAAACLMAGCLVRRDMLAAEHLVARIPVAQRARAQTLVQEYVAQHDLWLLKDYVEPEAKLLGDTVQAPDWEEPRQWPGLVKDTALWLLDLVTAEPAD